MVRVFQKRKQLDKRAGAERERISDNPNARNSHGKNPISMQSSLNSKAKGITTPATPEAKLWNGWKSHGLKPAYEPILLAMKPNEGNYAENLNIDGGRIKVNLKKEPDIGDSYYLKRNKKYPNKGSAKIMGRKSNRVDVTMKQGRYPANLILDEESGRLLDEQSGVLCSKWGTQKNYNYKDDKAFLGKLGNKETALTSNKFTGDSGGASRFFYVAKASKAERNAGCERLKTKGVHRYHAGIGEGKDPNAPSMDKNNHPTVKPLALMGYLCKLTKTPTDGIVLDPFMGSGTTGIAAIKNGQKFIGIEKKCSYCRIAIARIKNIRKGLFY